MNEQELQDLHKLVWEFRAVAGEYWPTPGVVDALRYAFTEAGEAVDATLRDQRPDDKRNRDKDVDRLDEWADCAIMLITALPSFTGTWTPGYNTYPERICLRVAEHLDSRVCSDVYGTIRTEAGDEFQIALTISIIANLQGMELRARIVGRLQRIMHKHLPFQLWPYVQALLDVYKVFDPSQAAAWRSKQVQTLLDVYRPFEGLTPSEAS